MIPNRIEADEMAPRRRGSHALVICLCASVAAHAGVVALLPGLLGDAAPAGPAVLEVSLLPPQPLPMAPPEPEPALEKPAPPVRSTSGKSPAPRIDASPAVLSLPEPQAPVESAFTVPAPRPAEPVAAPEPKSQVASVAPPVFNAAYLRNPAPRYPAAARRAGEQGSVTLRVLVDREGQPSRVELERSSGSKHLDNAALETVKGWRFHPARRGTEAVEGWVLVPIVFRLEG